MANRFYSVVNGEQLADQVTEGAASSSEAIELRVSDTVYSAGTTAAGGRLQVILGVRAILQYLESTETDPIA